MPNFFINVKEKGAKKAELSIKSLTKSLGGLAVGYFGVQQGAEALKKSIIMSAEMEGVKRGFDNLALSSGFSANAFNSFKKATDGTIDSLTLMKQANNAMLLGIADSEQQMADMFDVAQRLGQSLGIDTTQSIESLVTGLGRQSKLMLDNLGIMVDTEKVTEQYAESIGKTVEELTDQERKQAFVNGAMAEANKLVKQLGDETLTTKDNIAQASTALGDLAIVLGDKLQPVVKTSTNIFTDAVAGYKALTDATSQLSIDTIRASSDMEQLVARAAALQVDKDIDLFGMMFSEENQKELDAINARLQRLRLIKASIRGDDAGSDDNIIMTQEDAEKANAELVKLFVNLVKLDKQKKKSADATKKLTKEELEAYALTGRTAKSAMAKVVKAELMEAVAGHIASIFKNVPFPFNAILAAGAGGTVSSLFDKAMAQIPEFATGGDFVTNGKQMIMVGDNPSGRERVQITPLGGDPAPDAPSGNVTVNVSGNVMSQDFVEGELADSIKNAIRRGSDFGIS